MTTITLNNLGKKFGREWIFRKLDFEIPPKDKVVILGGNGSGKSTLLQVISGYITPNEGKVVYSENNQPVPAEEIKDKVSFASPYLQLVEDFTLFEMVEHAAAFKPFLNEVQAKDAIRLMELEPASQKYIKQFSSGMKQRVKLGLAILSVAPVLLLDEPASNLDPGAIEWFLKMVEAYAGEKTILVCSNNIPAEFSFCKRQLNVMDFKPLSPIT